MDEVRLEKLIEETLSTMDPVEVPKDLHFDAAKIMRLARMEEESEAEKMPAPLSFMDRLRQAFQSRSMVRFAGAAAAFVVLLGVYGVWKSGSVPAPLPGNDPAQTAEIDDPGVPTTLPDNPIVVDDPVQTEDPVTPDVPDEPPAEDDPVVTPPHAVTPQQPVQSAENPKPPVVTPPAPQPPAAEPEEPVAEDEPPVEEEPGEVDNPTEYAGGNEIDPEEQIPDDETPAAPPEEQTGEETADPEENEFEILLEEALQDEAFAADFAAEDKGFGHNIVDVQDVPEGTEFMVYFYESEEEQLAGTVNEDDIRSILWKKESL
ncbi:MAG: hypothetical protein IJK80_00795 [Firmicutes bacterium]|nr:hypothetical protein [Bacillota bacterium]